MIFCLGFVFSCSNNSDDSETITVRVDRSANLLATGASANDILSNANFDELRIEIGFVTRFRPTQTAMNNFVDFLRDRTFKQDIEIIYTELPSPNEETLVLEEIADLEEENRTAYNDGSTLAIYIYFADAPSDGDDLDEGLVTLGAVYQNTSMIIYESTIRNLASRSSLVSVTELETATLNHEFGHLFGLVNLGTDAINDHEDPEADNHCIVDGCLMRAQLQFGATARTQNLTGKASAIRSACNLNGNSVLKILESNVSRGFAAVPLLDAECLLDLESNGGR